VLILRPVASEDLDALVRLAGLLDSVNLPSDPSVLRNRIRASLGSFGEKIESWRDGLYVFVLEDDETRRCIGTSMILAKHGTPGAPYYWLEVSAEERRSVELDRRFVHTKLRLRSTEDGPTEVGGLVLDPEYRQHPSKCGKALSVVRGDRRDALAIRFSRHEPPLGSLRRPLHGSLLPGGRPPFGAHQAVHRGSLPP
jgi:arginine N-succinyltransferase